MRSLLYFISFLAIALLSGFLASQFSASPMLFLGVLAIVIFAVTFVNIEWGLYALIFSMLLSPEFMAGETGGASLGRGVTLRLDDFLLAVIGFSWFAKNAVNKELGLFLKTPLNRPIFYYILACIVSTGFGIMTGRVEGKTGFFFVIKYVEYFIVFLWWPTRLKTPSR